MNKIKALALIALLALSANVSAAEVGRQQYLARCEASAVAAGNIQSAASAVCNCSAQAISYALTDGLDRYKQWTVDIDNPMVQNSINLCVKAANEQPYNFMLYFGSENASVR
jgi:hypothetical protein